MGYVLLNECKICLVALVIIGLTTARAQVRIGTGSINSSASLDVTSGPYPSGSSYRGLLPPSLPTTSRDQIQSPATGLLIFNTTTNQIEVNTGTTTAPIWTPGGATSTGGGSNSWSLTGNAGTSGSTNFLGTTDNTPLNFRVNNQNAGRINPILNNVSFGYLALNSGTTGQNNTSFGVFSLYSNTSSSNNTASGFKALFANTTGMGNTASGTVAMQSNMSGQGNTAFGFNALAANVAGDYSTAVGAGALQKSISTISNTAVGHNALAANTTGVSNVAFGEDALIKSVDGRDNVALGNSALDNNTSGNYNLAAGNFSLKLNSTGTNNTASGHLALQYNTTGANNTALGFNAGPPVANPNLTNSTAIGANALVNASNEIVLGDNNITAIRSNVQTISSLSDKRIKEDIQANVPGLSFITRLTPVTYHINKLKEARLVGYSLNNLKEDGVLHSGFLAQDVEKAAQAVNYSFEGVRQEAGGSYYTIGYTLFVMPLVQAVKELNAEVESLKAELKTYDKLAAQVKQMQELLGVSKARSGGRVGKR